MTITLNQCIGINPAIGNLIKDARAKRSRDPINTFYRGGYRDRVSDIVGWAQKHDPVLGTSRAYDLVYEAVLEALGY